MISQTITTFEELEKAVKQMPSIANTSRISKSITELNTFIGLNVSATSVLRKQAYTKPVLQSFCNEHGLTLVDNFPNHCHLSILLNTEQ